ncbi:MAG: hypothetical protein AAF636_19805 [Pseudomonadota bacterium]
MTRSVMFFMGGLARFFYRLIATPVLLGWMIGRTLFGAMIGFLIGGVVALSAFGPPLGQSAWEWAIILPPTFISAGTENALLRRSRVLEALRPAGRVARKG